MSYSVLEMLSETTRKIVMGGSMDDKERFKVLMEGLHKVGENK